MARHGATVLRVCRAVVGPDDAEDAWSETFLAALAAYPALPGDANVEAWLVTIAHRKGVDALRARQRRAVPTAEVPERAARADPAGPAVEVWAQVKDLPDKQRQVLAYRYLAGLPYQDIADILGGTAVAARRAAADGI
ncbi:RNA polymerase sigma factor [Georgenia sp. TF02-10]|uniref:RNA polymerase sigma factor n=1 Tax=Georgenia sp. TF02-10 TaxID=2917725 RepID=UPI001FA6C1E5|nr:RNA polymerase sigma factor [Georgenia sp. TF02-10]UNX56311.1 RNA polymerase sigma factor [Georgenia sp. TF02-10]